MFCENCDPFTHYPGKLIKTKRDFVTCTICGRDISKEPPVGNSKWDTYFHSICIAVASKSPCLSRKIGAILVRDHSIVATGYNGPARGVPHCGHERFMKDNTISKRFEDILLLENIKRRIYNECPRKLMGYASGEGMQWCPAQHAEANCISNAARLGVSTLNSILYMNCIIPCKNCFGALINAGIVEIVIDDAKPYDKHTQFIIDNSSISIREFQS